MKAAAAFVLLLSACAVLNVASLKPVTRRSLRQAGLIPDLIDDARLGEGPLIFAAYGQSLVDSGALLTKAETQPKNLTAGAPGQTVAWYAEDDSQLYTLIIADPDAPSRANPIRRSILHQMVVNVPGGDIKRGTTLQAYRGPAPPLGGGVHRYTYLLFRQPRTRGQGERRYHNDDGASPANTTITVDPADVVTVNFNVRAFAAKYGLGYPVAVNWFSVAAADAFSSPPPAGP